MQRPCTGNNSRTEPSADTGGYTGGTTGGSAKNLGPAKMITLPCGIGFKGNAKKPQRTNKNGEWLPDSQQARDCKIEAKQGKGIVKPKQGVLAFAIEPQPQP